MPHHLTVSPHTTERAQITMRANICSHCPDRSKGAVDLDTSRACEAGCEFFKEIPAFVDIAKRIDPMVGSFDDMMTTHIKEVCKNLMRSAKGRRQYLLSHKEQFIDDLKKIVGH